MLMIVTIKYSFVLLLIASIFTRSIGLHPATDIRVSNGAHGYPFQLFQSLPGDRKQLCRFGINHPSCLLVDNVTDNLQYLAYQLGNIVYSIFFHPLSNVPGPWYLAASRIPYIRHNLNGTLLPWMQELHEKYGTVVRYSPNEVGDTNGHH